MAKYEYIVVDVGSNKASSTKILNDYASKGWRLVQIEQTMGYSVRYVFEREANNEGNNASDIP